ncbi:MAG: hypothetical protein MI861_02365, partial [Pirellulales bacterium]|nr:hypothetical protein [Pirellulales bacterium]
MTHHKYFLTGHPILACWLACGWLWLPVSAQGQSPVSAQGQAASGWSEFHGPSAQGVSSGTLPAQWDDSDYVWRRPLGSRDVGSPVIHNGRVYYLVSNPKEGKIAVESRELSSGKLRWTRQFNQPNHHLHRRNTYASSTPAADDQNIFVCWSDPQHTYLKCFDHDGQEIWSRDFGTWQSQHGFGTSPRIYGSLVLLFNSQQAEQLRPGQTAG